MLTNESEYKKQAEDVNIICNKIKREIFVEYNISLSITDNEFWESV